MMKPSGAHTHPGTGGGRTALMVLAVIIGLAVATPIAHAASNFLRVAVDALEVVMIVAAAAVSLAVVARLVFFVARLRAQNRRQLALLQSQQQIVASREQRRSCRISRRPTWRLRAVSLAWPNCWPETAAPTNRHPRYCRRRSKA